MHRRFFLYTTAGALCGSTMSHAASVRAKAQIAITFDLEMSRHYPRRGMLEWDFKKGELDKATKEYALGAARIAKQRGAAMHFFLVGRTLEQPDVQWIREIAEMGHAIGNHTYDHVSVWAAEPEDTQFRFRRAPWLARGMNTEQLIRENIEITSIAMQKRLSLAADGFRTPGGSYRGLEDREDLQKMLLDLGFQWVSSKYPRHASGKPKQEPDAAVYDSIVAAQKEAQPFVYPTGLIEIPMSPISDVTAFRSHYWKREYFLRAIRLAVEWAIENKAVFDFLAHPSCLVVEDPKFEAVKLMCDLVERAQGAAEIVTLSDIAKSVS